MSQEFNKTFTTESGVELSLCPVSQIDLIPLQSLLSKGAPKPPVEIIEGKAVSNEAHPDYLAARETFDANQSVAGLAVLIELGVEVDLTDEQLARIEKGRKRFARVYPHLASSPEFGWDIYQYVKSICPTMDEIKRLADAIASINSPTAQQVQEHLDSFRPDVSEQAADVDQDAPVGDNVPFRIDRTQPGKGGNLGKRAGAGVL